MYFGDVLRIVLYRELNWAMCKILTYMQSYSTLVLGQVAACSMQSLVGLLGHLQSLGRLLN